MKVELNKIELKKQKQIDLDNKVYHLWRNKKSITQIGKELKMQLDKVHEIIQDNIRFYISQKDESFNKVKYYETERDIERQLLFDKGQLRYSIDELSKEEKQLLK